MCYVFDQWMYHDVGRIFVQLLTTYLASGGEPATPYDAVDLRTKFLLVEQNGDVFSCDHFSRL